MAGLGLVTIWAGYWLFAYGFAFYKGAAVTLTDLALPSHRGDALAAIKGAQKPVCSTGTSAVEGSLPTNNFSNQSPAAKAAGTAFGWFLVPQGTGQNPLYPNRTNKPVPPQA